MKRTGSVRSSDERSKVSKVLMSNLALVSTNPETTTVCNGFVLSETAILSHQVIEGQAQYCLPRLVHVVLVFFQNQFVSFGF